MRTRQPPGPLSVVDGDRQLLEPLARDGAGHVERRGFGSPEFSEAILRSDLQADAALMRISFPGSAMAPWAAADKRSLPPNHHRKEWVSSRNAHLDYDSQAASSASGSGSKNLSSTTTRPFMAPEPPDTSTVPITDQPRNRCTVASNHDLFTASTRASSRERWVLASCTLTTDMVGLL